MPAEASSSSFRCIVVSLLTTFLFSGCAITPMDEAEFALDQGDYQTALAIFEGEVGELENWTQIGKSGGIPKPSLSPFRISIYCNAYFQLRRFDKAEQCIESYARVTFAQDEEKLDGNDIKSDALWARWVRARHVEYDALKSALALELGDFKTAYEHGILAVELNRRKMDEPASQMLGLRESASLQANTAIAAYHQGRTGEAKQLVESIRALKVPFGSVELAPDVRFKNSEQARVYLAMNDYGKAEQALSQSLGITGVLGRAMAGFTSLGMTEFLVGESFTNPFSVNQFFMRTKICFERSNYECARKGYDAMISGDYEERLKHLGETLRSQAEQNASLLRRPAILYTALYDRGRIALHQSDQNLALQYFSEAIDVIEAQRSSINTEASKIGFVGDKESIYRDIVSLLVDLERFDEAFVYAERAKARALVDTLASRQSIGKRTDKAEIRESIESIEQEEVRIDKLGHAISNRQRGVELALRKTQKQSLNKIHPELASLVSVSTPDLSELQSLISKDETLLEYYGDEKNLFVFVLSKGGVFATKLNSNDLVNEVAVFRATLTDPDDSSYQRSGTSLYNRLVAPVASAIKTKAVTIVPHGILHYLPFTALTDNGQFMIDRYEMRVLPSASVMKFINKGSTAPNDLLALGNPDVGDPALDLPGAQQEVEAVIKGLRHTQLLTREHATETAIKTRGNAFRRLHFASHGIFDAENPLESGLLLAADDNNDGLLTVGELYELELNADLITLSACETALGKIANGDDVVGFTRGFLYAGTDSIVSSLWKVDDAATNQLMQAFYQTLQTLDRRAALRAAQLSVKYQFPHPYYWAAFQLTGAVN